jgi:hypothetical protein
MGGQMNEVERNLVAAKSPRGVGTRKKAIGRGAAKLREAASKALARNSTKIAKSLVDNSVKGHLPSTQLLIKLADGSNGGGDAAEALLIRSLAKEWAAEPEWNADQGEEAAETASGSRETDD